MKEPATEGVPERELTEKTVEAVEPESTTVTEVDQVQEVAEVTGKLTRVRACLRACARARALDYFIVHMYTISHLKKILGSPFFKGFPGHNPCCVALAVDTLHKLLSRKLSTRRAYSGWESFRYTYSKSIYKL